MARKDIGNKLDRENRNAHNDNYKELYKEVNDFKGSITDELYERIIDGAKLNWKEPVASQSDLPSSATEGDTRMARDTGKVYRYDGSKWVEIQQIDAGPVNELDSRLTSQLAEEVTSRNKAFESNKKNGITFRSRVRGAVTFVDDDTSKEAYDILFNDFVKGRGVPFLFALIGDRVENGNPASITMKQFKEMKQHELVEFGNHTTTHPHLNTLTEEEIDYQIGYTEKFLRKNGIYTKVLIPPFGSVDNRVNEIAKKYVDNSLISWHADQITSINFVKNDFLNTDSTKRIDFSNDIETLKQAVRWAKQRDGWLIISTHAHYSQDPNSNLNFIPQKLHEFIDYCAEQELDILSYTEAFDIFRNVIDYRDKNGNIIAGLSAGGYSKGLNEGFYTPKADDPFYKVNIEDPPSVFPQFSVVKHWFSSSSATEYGFPSAGTLLTSTINGDAYAFQMYFPIRSKSYLYRTWDTSIQIWNDFTEVGKVSTIPVNRSFGSGYPGVESGKVRTYDVSSSSFELGDGLTVNPLSDIPSGIIFNTYIKSNGTAGLAIFNGTTDTFEISNTSWLFTVIK